MQQAALSYERRAQEIARLTAALSEHEAAHGPITLDGSPAANGSENGSTVAPPTGAPVGSTDAAAPAGPPPSGQTL